MSNKKPVHEVRFGTIKASIWGNHTKMGTRYGVSVVRLYRNGDHWSESTRFGRDDLLLLAKVLDRAHTWICERGHSENGLEVGTEQSAVGS